ncbi:VOC family protein [Brevibacterium sp. FAM 25378]|uniref:VOC family protein n=1 Tax=unclassified Brevibacterium TaxID=2614124 RepID=UPI0010923007|nr:VOC family protein [Brevibacterium sp. S22]TGD32140.1 glyoxalase [Brevibacterium sp. S22]
MGFDTIIVPVSDLAQGKKFYGTLLSTAPMVDESYYVAFDDAGVQVGLDPHGTPGGRGALPYRECEDIAETIRRSLELGASVISEPRDVGGGKLVGVISDPDGNEIGLTQAAY